MVRFARLLVAAALTLAVVAPASTAHAQATLAPLFTVPGCMNTSQLSAYVACTNNDTAPVSIGLDFFDQGGTQLAVAATNAVSLSPRATVLFGTRSALGVSIDVNIGPLAVISKGSAVVETTSKKIACSAFLMDTINNPPNAMTTLTMAYKGKQKGD